MIMKEHAQAHAGLVYIILREDVLIRLVQPELSIVLYTTVYYRGTYTMHLLGGHLVIFAPTTSMRCICV